MSIVIVLALTVPGVLFCVWFELALLRDESICAVAYHIEFKDILQESPTGDLQEQPCWTLPLSA
jgi:hypothetical protein